MSSTKPHHIRTTTSELGEILLSLVHEISSIRAGKTFAPTDYTEPVIQAIEQKYILKSKVIEAIKDCENKLNNTPYIPTNVLLTTLNLVEENI